MKFSMVLFTTLTIIPINFMDLNNLVILKTLNILIALNALTAFPLAPVNRVISMIESKTIDPSKIFILSLKYSAGPNAINLIPISEINMYVNIEFHVSSKSKSLTLVNVPANDKSTVFPITTNKRKLLTNFPLINS